MKHAFRLVLTIASIAFAKFPAFSADAQSSSGVRLSASQIEDLDREGAGLLDRSTFAPPPIDCIDVLDRVAGSQLRYLKTNAHHYLALPNGDIISAFRALRLRELEDDMRQAVGSRRERIERDYHELAPGGPVMVAAADGERRFDDSDIGQAGSGDTVFEYNNLPPLSERPIRPQPDTLAAYLLLGSRIESPEHTNFRIDQHTDHWLIGSVVGPDGVPSPRIAVHRKGARIVGNRLERATVLWPLNRTAEGRLEYWDRAPLPLYVALDAEALRATPAQLACAAEQDQVMLRNYTARSDRTRSVRRRESRNGTALVTIQRENGPWVHEVIWRANPVRLRVIDYDTHVERRDRAIAAQDRSAPHRDGNDNSAATDDDRVTHKIALRDGRTMRGRLVSDPGDSSIKFIVVVGSIEQTMSFNRIDVERIDPVAP